MLDIWYPAIFIKAFLSTFFVYINPISVTFCVCFIWRSTKINPFQDKIINLWDQILSDARQHYPLLMMQPNLHALVLIFIFRTLGPYIKRQLFMLSSLEKNLVKLDQHEKTLSKAFSYAFFKILRVITLCRPKNIFYHVVQTLLCPYFILFIYLSIHLLFSSDALSFQVKILSSNLNVVYNCIRFDQWITLTFLYPFSLSSDWSIYGSWFLP